MKTLSELIRKYASDAINPPPPEVVEDVSIPSAGKVPGKTRLNRHDLKKLEKGLFIYDRDQPLMDQIQKLKREKQEEAGKEQAFEGALEEMQEYLGEKNPTVVTPPPIMEITPDRPTRVDVKKPAQLSIDQIVKLCNVFCDLSCKD